jgi:tetratricopeptide (TPR) repeat protein
VLARRFDLRLAAVVIVALALHARTLGFGFSYLDDDVLVLGDQAFLSQPSSLWRSFGRPYLPPAGRDHAYYRPLVNASFGLDAQWGGGGPLAYRLTNLLLHALAAGLLFRLLRRLGHRPGVALFGGLLFAVHPALTEAVAWIPGRNDSLLAVFALASWLLLLRALETDGWLSRAGHLVAWLAALLAKEAAVVLPLVYLAHPLLVERRPWRTVVRPWLVVGWAAALGLVLIARAAVLPEGAGAAGVSAPRILSNLALYPISLGKLVLPLHLSVLATPEDSWLWPGAVGAALVFAALLVPGIRRASVLFAAACFAILVAPGLPASGLLALESRLYLPALGVVLAACEIARAVGGWPRGAKLAVGGVLVAVLAGASFSYGGEFRDRLTFSEAAVRGSPHSALAHRNLGVTYQLAGDPARARREYEAALGEDAAEPVVHNNLAVLYMATGQLAAAERELRQELAINPDYPQAHENLALVLRALGRAGEANQP